MRRAIGLLLAVGAFSFVGCQQTQEADDDGDGTTVIKEETTVEPAEEPADTKVDVDVQGGEEGVSGEVEVDQGATGN